MAEVIGALAAVLQILDFSIKSLGIISKWKGTPKAIHDLADQAEQLRGVMNALQANPAIDTAAHPIKDVLDDCLKDLQELQATFQLLDSNLGDGTIDRSWKAVRSIIKETDIQTCCRKIERHKLTLLLVLENESVSRLAGINVGMTSLSLGMDHLRQEIPCIRDLGPRMDLISASVTNMATSVSDIQVDARILKPSIERKIDSSTALVLDRLQANQTFVMQQLQTIKHLAERPQVLATELQRLGGPEVAAVNGGRCSSTTHYAHAHPAQSLVNPARGHFANSYPNLDCKCCAKRSSVVWGFQPNIVGFGKFSITRHKKSCPLFALQKGFHLAFHYAFPRWLLSKTVEVTFAATYGAGGFSVAPNLQLVPVVDYYSPAIELIQSWHSRCFDRSLKPKNVDTKTSETIFQLRQLFLKGEASPFDVTPSGSNLLQSFLYSVIFKLNRIDSDRECCSAFEQLIHFLVSCGTDINSTANDGRSCLAGCIEAYVRTSSKPEEQFIRKILLSMGAIAVGGPVVGISKGMDRQSFLRGLTNQLRANWDYAEDVLLCGPLAMAVLQKSESLLRSLIQQRGTPDEKNALGQRPIHLCADWAAGTRILLDAGFKCNVLDDNHVTPVEFALALDGSEAASLLFKAGCPLTCWVYHSKMTGCETFSSEHSIRTRWPIQAYGPKALNLLLIKEIIDRRTRVANLASHHLPQHVLDWLGSLGTAVDDNTAHATWEALIKLGFQIPPGLDTLGLFVYHQYLTVDLAELLYNMGFCNLDAYDSSGLTPLMVWACQWKPDMAVATWFLENGADPLKPHRDHDLNALHVAICARRPFHLLFSCQLKRAFSSWWLLNKLSINQLIDPVVIDGGYDTKIISPIMQRLLQEISPTSHDSCKCSCSASGCTPTTMLLKCHLSYYGLGRDRWLSEYVYKGSALLFSWYMAIAAVGGPVNEVREEVRRFIAFAELDLTHTCCRKGFRFVEAIVLMPKEDVEDIREEEEELIDQLEQILNNFESRPWKSSSKFDYLGEVNVECQPPTLRWANLVTARSAYGLDKGDCEKIRQASGISIDDFWQTFWDFSLWNKWVAISEVTLEKELPKARYCEISLWIEFYLD